MKTFKASKFQHQPGEIFDAARKEPVVVQRCKTNGEVIEEFVMFPRSDFRISCQKCGTLIGGSNPLDSCLCKSSGNLIARQREKEDEK